MRISALAAWAPLTLLLISPSLLSLRSTNTFWILASSAPSLAGNTGMLSVSGQVTVIQSFYSPSSLKSSTRMISLIRCSGLLLRTLTMVLSRVDLASL